MTVPRISSIIGMIVTFMFHNFFQLSGKVLVFVQYLLWSAGTPKSKRWHVLFLLNNTKSVFMTVIGWPICISKSQGILCFIFKNRFWYVHIPFVSMVKLQSLAQFLMDHFSPSHVLSCVHTNKFSAFDINILPLSLSFFFFFFAFYFILFYLSSSFCYLQSFVDLDRSFSLVTIRAISKPSPI